MSKTISKEAFDAWRTGRKPLTAIDKEWRIGGVRLRYEHRLRSNAMGRFGGGWQWNIGVQIGGRTVIINLLVASLRIERMNSCAGCGDYAHPNVYKRHEGEWGHYHRDCWAALGGDK